MWWWQTEVCSASPAHTCPPVHVEAGFQFKSQWARNRLSCDLMMDHRWSVNHAVTDAQVRVTLPSWTRHSCQKRLDRAESRCSQAEFGPDSGVRFNLAAVVASVTTATALIQQQMERSCLPFWPIRVTHQANWSNEHRLLIDCTSAAAGWIC